MPIFAFSGSLTRPMPQYGAANGRGLTSFSFDPASGRLTALAELGGIDDTAWVLPDAARHRLYSTCEIDGTDQSAIASFAVDPASGALTELGRQPLGGGEACHASLSPDGRWLFVACYNGATPAGWPDQSVAVLPVEPTGLGPVRAHIRQHGSGPNRERQTAAHAHCVVPSPDGRFIYVADLGIDRILAYAMPLDGGDAGRPAAELAVPPGTGPRHLVFSADGRRLFMVSELIPTVLSLEVDPATGAMRELDTFPIARSSDRLVQPAGILLAPDGRHLFIGLRVTDEILGLAVDPATGTLSQTGRWPSGGRTPRDFALSPDGRFLIVANQDSDRLSVFGVGGGTLSGPVGECAVGTPMTVKLAAF